MKLHIINAVNAYAMIILSVYRYNVIHTPEKVNLVPVFFAVLLLICNSGIQYHNKPMIHSAFLMSVVALAGIIHQYTTKLSVYHTDDKIGLILMGVICAVSLLRFLFYYVTGK